MKLTKKRVAIATAAAALATVGIFGGTYAKYSIETLPTTDNARLAKFYLKSDNELQLFSTGYKNSEMESADVANFFGFTDNLIAPNERLTPEQVKRKGYFVFHNDVWWLVNEDLPDLTDVANKTAIPIGGKIELKEGVQILFSKEDGGRLAVVQMVEA